MRVCLLSLHMFVETCVKPSNISVNSLVKMTVVGMTFFN